MFSLLLLLRGGLYTFPIINLEFFSSSLEISTKSDYARSLKLLGSHKDPCFDYARVCNNRLYVLLFPGHFIAINGTCGIISLNNLVVM